MPLPLETARLILRLAAQADAPALVSFYTANREHLAPYEPVRPAEFYTEAYWRERARINREEFRRGASLRLVLFKRDEPETVIGVANFSGFVYGAAHMCTLGYALGAGQQGRGYMREALEAAIAYVFDELRMHRIQANYMPHNTRSGGLLERLGFVREGLAKDYLLIDGAWRDHVLTSLTNPHWRPWG